MASFLPTSLIDSTKRDEFEGLAMMNIVNVVKWIDRYD